MPSWEQEGFFMPMLELQQLLDQVKFRLPDTIQAQRQQLLEAIRTEQIHFSEALGNTKDSQNYLGRSYDVVTDYVTLRWYRERGEWEKYRQHIELINANLQTNLMERYKVTESSLEYDIKDNLYPKGSLTPSLYMILNGVDYRKNLGSVEQERELAELIGFQVIDEFMVNVQTPIGSTIVSFSPKGSAEHTEYRYRFVDIFVKQKRDQDEYVQFTRKFVRYNNDEYREKALELDPTFFDGYDGQGAEDAWFLSHPVVTNKDVSSFFDLAEGMDFTSFQNIYHDEILQYLIHDYLRIIQETTVDRVAVAASFNCIINRADEVKENVSNELNKPFFQSSLFYDDLETSKMFYSYLQSLAIRNPKTHSGTGCPSNRGYNLGNSLIDSIDVYRANSVVQFIPDRLDYKDDPNLCRCSGREPHFHCPGKNGTCRHIIIVGKGITTCPICGQGKIC